MGFWSTVGGIALDVAKRLPSELAKREASVGRSIEKLGDSATDKQKEMLSSIKSRQAAAEERAISAAERQAAAAERKKAREEEEERNNW